MRDAAADLDFEKAARLRDEIKRLKAAELAVMDDPMAREEVQGDGRQRKEEGRGSHESLSPLWGEDGSRQSRAGWEGKPANAEPPSYFAKPSLDDMGPGTDTARPLFRKPDLDEMGRDIAEPKRSGSSRGGQADATGSLPLWRRVEEGSHTSLFRRNTLDEMTVGRTEKPVTGKLPEKPDAAKSTKRFSPLLEGQPERDDVAPAGARQDGRRELRGPDATRSARAGRRARPGGRDGSSSRPPHLRTPPSISPVTPDLIRGPATARPRGE